MCKVFLFFIPHFSKLQSGLIFISILKPLVKHEKFWPWKTKTLLYLELDICVSEGVLHLCIGRAEYHCTVCVRPDVVLVNWTTDATLPQLGAELM